MMPRTSRSRPGDDAPAGPDPFVGTTAVHGARLWFWRKELLMSIEGKTPAGAGTPAYLTRFDGVRVPASDYHPVWLGSLAGDVTIGRRHHRGLGDERRRAGRRGRPVHRDLHPHAV
jgi:hypothetical protein